MNTANAQQRTVPFTYRMPDSGPSRALQLHPAERSLTAVAEYVEPAKPKGPAAGAVFRLFHTEHIGDPGMAKGPQAPTEIANQGSTQVVERDWLQQTSLFRQQGTEHTLLSSSASSLMVKLRHGACYH
jgi:hypothetical protein